MTMQHAGALDIIGDVHGEHDALVALLTKLGYRNTWGAWRHPENTAVFVGDLIDRGPQQVEVVNTVRSMRDAGSALISMGNHEWNAIAWVTPRELAPGEMGSGDVRSGDAGSSKFLRAHTENKARQHAQFLSQVGDGSRLHHELIDWFRTIPIWLDLPGVRVVHACWQPTKIALLDRETDGTRLASDRLLQRAHINGSEHYDAVETVLKGIETELPNGLSFVDKDGKERHHARIQWWQEHPRTFQRSALVEGEEVRKQLPDLELPAGSVEDDPDPRPIIFGHYWAKWPNQINTKRAMCVDFSATKGGHLVAYRWSGESDLTESNLVAVDGPRS